MQYIVSIGLVILVVVTLVKTARIVPQRQAFVIERLGKFLVRRRSPDAILPICLRLIQ